MKGLLIDCEGTGGSLARVIPSYCEKKPPKVPLPPYPGSLMPGAWYCCANLHLNGQKTELAGSTEGRDEEGKRHRTPKKGQRGGNSQKLRHQECTYR